MVVVLQVCIHHIFQLGKQSVHAGLAPGKPCVDNMSPDAKVLPTDADFVVIMHIAYQFRIDIRWRPLLSRTCRPDSRLTSICLDIKSIILG